jgi:hypothetical protein
MKVARCEPEILDAIFAGPLVGLDALLTLDQTSLLGLMSPVMGQGALLGWIWEQSAGTMSSESRRVFGNRRPLREAVQARVTVDLGEDGTAYSDVVELQSSDSIVAFEALLSEKSRTTWSLTWHPLREGWRASWISVTFAAIRLGNRGSDTSRDSSAIKATPLRSVIQRVGNEGGIVLVPFDAPEAGRYGLLLMGSPERIQSLTETGSVSISDQAEASLLYRAGLTVSLLL